MMSLEWSPAAVEKCFLNYSVLGKRLRHRLNQSGGSNRRTPRELQSRAAASCFLLGDDNQLHR